MDTLDQRPTEQVPAQADRLHTFAHGIKNRLGALWEVLQLMREDLPGATKEELMAHAERAFFGAQQDVERLMDDLHVDRAITAQHLAPFTFAQALKDAMDRNAHRFSKKGQRVEVSSPTDVTIRADAHWVVRIIDAMLSNASKFSPEGSTINVSITSDAENGLLEVTDHGVGLTAEDLEQVFSRYALLTSRTTNGEQQMRGTLARAHQWAQANGGRLRATSRGQGQGSSFELRLPLA